MYSHDPDWPLSALADDQSTEQIHLFNKLRPGYRLSKRYSVLTHDPVQGWLCITLSQKLLQSRQYMCTSGQLAWPMKSQDCPKAAPTFPHSRVHSRAAGSLRILVGC